jgi:septum formation protein
MQIILASGSPRRKDLFSQLGLDFTVTIPHVDEKTRQGEHPEDFCHRVSMDKAACASQEYPDALIIAADTIVVIDGKILGKPRDDKEARAYLMLLEDRTHEVYTGYTIMYKGENKTKVIRTRVHFRAMSAEEIQWYIATGEPLDKAGAYAVQGIGSIFVDRLEGSYTNVIGLPLSDLYYDLKGFGIVLDLNDKRGSTYG